MRTAIIIFFICMLSGSHAVAQNFTNKGKEFWVGYGHNHLFNYQALPNSQSMVLYLSAEQAATVTVSINGTSWVRTYVIPANTVVPSDLIPKDGPDDCRILTEGLSNHAIHIVSDVPIVAFAHTYGLNSSGGTMLLPVESYNYTYYSINSEQVYNDSCYSWFYIVASENNTKVRITPVRPTVGGRAQNVPFEVTLQKGQIYNVMGKRQTSGNGFDMSGSKIQSLPGDDGVCHPIGVFSGSSRTSICLSVFDFLDSGSDFSMDQVFPVTAWGTKYVLGLTSSADGAAILNNNRVRVYLRDKNTQVKVNGTILTGLTNNFFYDYLATTSDVITASKPVMVAQFITSGYGCGSTGDGDPEMLYISPVDQAIKTSYWYNTNLQNIEVNYVTLVIPTPGLASLKIDGSSTFDYTYPHPNAAGYSVVVKQLQLAPMQHNATSDSGFTAVTYGLGHVESYGYNAGTYIKNLEATVQVKNEFGTTAGTVTCAGTNFGIRLKTTYRPGSITFKLSAVAGLTPNADTTLTNPQPNDSSTEGGRKYFIYLLPGNYSFAATGIYNIPVTVTDAQIENCSFSVDINIPVDVIDGPTVDFTSTALQCAKDSIVFTGVSADDIGANNWRWKFGDSTIDSIKQVTKTYPVAADYTVSLLVVRSNDGCTAAKEKLVTIHPLPIADFHIKDSIICMPGGAVNFINQSTIQGNAVLTYLWSFGDNTTNITARPQHVYPVEGNYTVKLLVAEQVSGCKDSATLTVNGFAAKPVAAFTPATIAACAQTAVSLADISTSESNIISSQWDVDNNLFSSDKNPEKSFEQAGNYQIKLIVKNNKGCSDTAIKQAQIFAVPIVNAGPDKLTTPGIGVTLDGTVNDPAAILNWSPAGLLNAPVIIDPVATVQATQLFYLTATSINNCMAKDSVLIEVLTKLFVPGAFSPNGDGLNDTWQIPALKAYNNASIIIFNRYGQKVFEEQGYNIPWDGYYKGNPLPVGAYMYIIDTHTKIGGAVKGSVIIIR